MMPPPLEPALLLLTVTRFSTPGSAFDVDAPAHWVARVAPLRWSRSHQAALIDVNAAIPRGVVKHWHAVQRDRGAGSSKAETAAAPGRRRTTRLAQGQRGAVVDLHTGAIAGRTVADR